jgi:ribosomal RNA-processing protein 12
VINEFHDDIEVDTQKFMLEQILEFVVSNQRQVVESSLNFLIVAIKVFPASLIFQNLPVVVKALTIMAPDPKRYCRLTLGFLLKRMCKRFTAEEVIKLVPGSDELTHKRLKKIRKEMARAKRLKQQVKEKEEVDEDDEFDNLEKKTDT